MKLEELSNDELIKYLMIKTTEFAPCKERMKTGVDYYNYKQEIDDKKRIIIGKNGQPMVVRNLPNTIIKDNQYARALDQKRSYVLSQKPNINSYGEKNTQAVEYATELIDNRFMRTLNQIATDSYNCSIGWLFVYTDGEEIKYKRIDPLSVIPEWSDDNHDSLDAVIRRVNRKELVGDKIETRHYIYLYMVDKIKKFEIKEGNIEFIEDEPYLSKGEKEYSYKKIPFVYFKQPDEIALIERVRCLQDALNLLLSNYADNMFENPMNSILVLKNYEGEDLGEFREKLAQYSAIKVRTADGSQGGVDTLEVEVNAENYKVVIELIKKAIAHNARSLYLDNERTTTAPNSLNIKSMYSDMELDANDLELEFTASFEYLFSWISDVKKIDFSNLDIKFKRSIMVNDESTVQMIRDSQGIISDETLRGMHPFVDDVQEETDRMEKQEKDKLSLFDDYQIKSDENE